MEKKINFKTGELIVNDSSIVYKSNDPFTLNTISKNDFAGVHITEEKYLKYGDWNYAFRCCAIGFVLMFTCFGIGYGFKDSSIVANAFLWLGIIVGQLVSLGGLIILLSIWDALFGSKITYSLLYKFFGKEITKVILASSTNEHIEFYIESKTEQDKLGQIKELNTLLK